MSIVILNRVSKEEKNYADWLRDTTEEIYIFNHKESANTFNGERVNVKVFENYTQNGLVDYEVIKLHEKDSIKALVALEEGEIIRAGYLREYLNIEGQKYESAVKFRDKHLMKLKLSQNGINVPPFRMIKNKTDLIDFIKVEEYPVIIKPLDSWSSKGIEIIKNKAELKKCLLSNPLENHLVEKYINTPIYHVDGIIINNKYKFICSSAYINTPLAYKEYKSFGSVLFERGNNLSERLIEFVKHALSKMPLAKDMSFHVEVFHDERNNEFLICEMGSRTIGAGTDKIIKHSFNIDLDKILTQAVCGVDLDLEIKERNVSGQLFIRPKKGFLKHIPKKLPFEWCFDYEIKGYIGKYYDGSLMKSTEAYADIYFEGENQEELLSRVKILEQFMIDNTVWSCE
ncbi:ATP-grasp domain-containing protein [Halolactibacillus halophilus]|uniref:ATP-grasp domain-containing protein n=1 Tax=Halolactibacillus halophilus TaxID=306540 RepID=A0A1I5RWH6_9BACI|nr:ATP-grasp domain-containing protein [Halolactibacillus halophilus]GEM02785.1 carboxylate--amine ligase [Halolactibacillus halophilus]SFP62888.1 ATP-grasp domain-containing protein [Halolactibacillus halophilus]